MKKVHAPIDLNEINIFHRVLQTGSFTAAASALGLPKSTVSERVARLEERLGVRLIDQGQLIQVFSIGDSIAVLCDGDCIKSTFPLAKASEFTRSPQLLCTNPVQNAFLDKVDINYDLVADWSFRDLKQPALLCMTDALGHWLLSHRDHNPSPVSILRKVRTPAAFSRFVKDERTAGRMKRDDTTLLALW